MSFAPVPPITYYYPPDPMNSAPSPTTSAYDTNFPPLPSKEKVIHTKPLESRPPLPSLRELTDRYSSSYRPLVAEEKKPFPPQFYYHICGDPINMTEFHRSMSHYLETVKPPFPYQGNPYGKSEHDFEAVIQKKNLEIGDSFFFRTDLHGDAYSLIKNLEHFRDEGYLDEDFKVKEEYKNKVLFVFGGDHGDRGADTLKTFQLLAHFKALNADEVVLLKGNHEKCGMTKVYISDHESVDSAIARPYLDEFFHTMPEALLIGGSADEKGRRQYNLCVHAAIDPRIDLSPALRDAGPFTKLSYDTRARVNAKIASLVENVTKHEELPLDVSISVLEELLAKEIPTEEEKALRKKSKIALAAMRVKKYADAYLDTDIPTYYNNQMLWGDPTYTAAKNDGRGAKSTTQFIHDYLSTTSNPHSKVKKLLSGHVHKETSRSCNTVRGAMTKYREGFITTLPSGGELNEYGIETDVMTRVTVLGPKVADWKHQKVSRKQREEAMVKDEEILPFYQSFTHPTYDSGMIEALVEKTIMIIGTSPKIIKHLEGEYEDEGHLKAVLSDLFMALSPERLAILQKDLEEESPVTTELLNLLVTGNICSVGSLIQNPIKPFQVLLSLQPRQLKHLYKNFEAFKAQWKDKDYLYKNDKDTLPEPFMKAVRRYMRAHPAPPLPETLIRV
jgi:hypothetical protein